VTNPADIKAPIKEYESINGPVIISNMFQIYKNITLENGELGA
jgi:hypothetical protein